MRTLGLDLGTKTLGELKQIIKEKQITDIVLGYPKNMDNSEGFASQRSLDFKKELDALNINVHLEDERLSTVEALNILKATGNKKIKEKAIVDAVAASIILERYLKGRENE